MKTLTALLKNLTRSSIRSSADLKVDLEQLDLAGLEQRVNDLEAERRRLLIAGDDADVAKIGDEIVSANLACERGAAARDELMRLIAEADQREAAAVVDDAVEKAEKVRREIGDTEAELNKAVVTINGLLAAIANKNHTLRDLNKVIERAGRPTVRHVEIAMVKRRILDRMR